MPEIFRFTQLRLPTGINIERVRQKHIQFFKGIEELQSQALNSAFQNGFEEGIRFVENYFESNTGFHNRAKIPVALATGNWEPPLFEGFSPFYELGYFLSQYKSDKSRKSNEALFSQINGSLDKLNKASLKEDIANFLSSFEDLLVLYFKPGAYPNYLRILIGLRRWHFVFNNFSLGTIKEALSPITDEPKITFEDTPVLHFLFEARILLPKYLFAKAMTTDDKPGEGGAPKLQEAMGNPVDPDINLGLGKGKLKPRNK